MDYRKIQTERTIFTDAWFIVKEHIGVESRPAADSEWDQIRNQCQTLYEKPGTPAQRQLATAVSVALMGYYDELCRTEGAANAARR